MFNNKIGLKIEKKLYHIGYILFLLYLCTINDEEKLLIMEFHCKQFSLNHSHSSMKVGTDSILLASLINKYLGSNKGISTILDVGTGCGILTLCMAQIFKKADITALDIDSNSVEESRRNFINSKWRERLDAIHISFEDFSLNSDKKFDLIISNPPYFSNSLPSPNITKSNARHNNSLSLKDFAESSLALSKQDTKIALILPYNETKILEDIFSKHLSVEYQCNIFAKEGKEIKRIVSIFSNSKTKKEENFYIRNHQNEYTEEYKQITKSFLL